MAIERISIEIKSNAKDIKDQLAELDARIKKLNAIRIDLQIRADKLETAKKSISNLDVAIKRLQAKKAELKVSTESADVAKKKMTELQRSIDLLKSKKAVLQVDTQKLKGADVDLKKVDRELTQLNSKRAKLQLDQSQITETGKSLDTLGQKVGKLGSTKTKIDISANLGALGSGLDNISNKMFDIIKTAALAGAAIVAAIGGKAITELAKSSIEMEKLAASFESLAGSVEGRKEMFGYINDFSLKSAFSGEDIGAVARNFLSIGESVKETNNWLKITGDIAGASGADMSRLGLVFSQVVANNKLNGQDWLQIINNNAGGLRSYIIAASEGTVTQGNFADRMKDGEITGKMFANALDLATSAGERFYQGTEKQSKTLPGILSNISENLLLVGQRMIGIDKATGDIKAGGIYDLIKQDAQKLLDVFTNNQDTITNWSKKAESAIINFYNKIKGFDWGSFGGGLKEGFGSIKDAATSFYDTIKPILDFAKEKITELGEGNFAKGLGELPALFIKVAVGAKLLGGAFTIISKLSNFKMPSFGGGKSGGGKGGFSFNFDVGQMLTQAKNLALVYGIIKLVEAAAEALKQVDEKVPANIAAVGAKLINMGIAIVGMGVLVGVAGALAKKNTGAAVAGLLVIAGISANLMLAAEAMKQINDKVPTDIASMATKLLNMGIAIAGMGALVAAAGLLVSTGVGAIVAAGGLLLIAGIAGEIMLVAEAISQMDKKVPSDISKVKSKIENIAKVIGYFTKANLGNLIDLFQNAVGALNIGVVTAGIGKMITLAKKLEGFANIAIPIGTDFKIREIQTILRSIDGANLQTLIDSTFGALDLVTLDSSVQTLIGIGTKFEGFKNISFNSVNVGNFIKNVQNSLDFIQKSNLSELIASAYTAIDLTILDLITGQLTAIGAKFEGFNPATFNSRNVQDYIIKVQDTLAMIEKSNIKDLENSVITTLDTTALTLAVEGIANTGNAFKAISEMTFTSSEIPKIRGNIKSIQSVMELIGGVGKTYADVITSLGGVLDYEAMAKSFESVSTIGRIIQNQIGGFDFDMGMIAGNIGKIKGVMGMVGKSDLGLAYTAMLKVTELEQIVKAMNLLTPVVEAMVAIQNMTINSGKIEETIKSMKVVLTAMTDFPATESLDSISSLVESFVILVETLNGLAGSFTAVGQNYGTETIAGFMATEVDNVILTIISDLLTKLEAKTEQFRSIGRAYGEALKNGFGTGIQNMGLAIDTQISFMIFKTVQFYSLGSTLGNNLVNGFSSAVSNLSSSISTQVSNIQSSLNSLTAPTITVPTVTVQGKSSGGEVAEYHAKGGMAGTFKPIGTDTIPAMLTPGEFVQSKKAVNMFGSDFMRRVNNLDIRGAYKAMTGRFSTYSNPAPSVTNNYNTVNNINNNNAKVNQNMDGGNQNYSMRRASRYLARI